jgi:capsular polysaccharide export protein
MVRRTRKLTLDQLVAGVLIRYPLYLDRVGFTASTPEAVIAELVAELKQRPSTVQMSNWRRKLRKLSHALRGMLRGA